MTETASQTTPEVPVPEPDLTPTEIIRRARAMRADPLYLLTNKRCAAAVHLYEKLGFRHDQDIMGRYGAEYERCDVAMRDFPNAPEPAVGS